MTAMHWAAARGDVSAVLAIIKKGGKQTASANKLFPIDMAAICDQKEVVKLLIYNQSFEIAK